MKLVPSSVIVLSMIGASMFSTSSHAGDFKFYSVGGCAPYTTGTPNYGQLRFRSESVQNQSNGYLYVICPIVRDTDGSWGTAGNAQGADVVVNFRTNTAGNFQCTLNIGSNVNSLWTSTKSVSGDPGDSLSMVFPASETATSDVPDSPVSMTCRLPPKGSIVRYYVNEIGPTVPAP